MINHTDFPICGRGEPIRLILEDAGIPYEESNDTAAFFSIKMDCEEYPFNQLPRLEVSTGSFRRPSGERADSFGREELTSTSFRIASR